MVKVCANAYKLIKQFIKSINNNFCDDSLLVVLCNESRQPKRRTDNIKNPTGFRNQSRIIHRLDDTDTHGGNVLLKVIVQLQVEGRVKTEEYKI